MCRVASVIPSPERVSFAPIPAEWRFEPLSTSLFPLGEGPFRARGLAYATALDYVDKRLKGGRAALLAELGPNDPWAPYLDQLFVAGANYDASPLVRLFVGAARLKGWSTSEFIAVRAHSSAKSAVHGIWKPLLKTSSPEAMAERLPLAFNRYFHPSQARTVTVANGRFDADLVKLPEPMAGMHVASTQGFVTAALSFAGARGVVFHVDGSTPDGRVGGVPLVRTRFSAIWST